MATDRVFVVGSGPSGVTAAYALLEQGVKVCMLDVGLTVEPERYEQVAKIITDGKAEEIRALLNDGTFDITDPTKFYRKLAYGSDFPYRGTDAFIGCHSGQHEIHSSFAMGGLSNVWGGSVMPFSDDDIRDWPLDRGSLAPHYRAVHSFLSLSGTDDALATQFPFFSDPVAPFTLSNEAKSLLAALHFQKERLAEDGIYAGRSRIAVGTSPGLKEGSDYLPELLIDGVTNGAIFNAAEIVKEMRHHPRFQYINQTTVTKFNETTEGVRIYTLRGKNEEPEVFEGSRLFLAAGVMPTARIVLSSLKAYNRTLHLKQSLHFLFPVLHFLPGLKHSGDRASSLAEIFIALQDTDRTGYWSFMSLYRFSGFFMDRIRDRYGSLATGIGALAGSPLLHLFICQGYLHSSLSPKMTLTMDRADNGQGGEIHITPHPHGPGKKTARRLIHRLSRKVRSSRIFPIGTALDANIPGRGNHLGGTFPMRDKPGDLECDTLGRPKGLSKIHIVDASVLPSIPATTITFGLMANAHRIAKASSTL